MWVKTEFFPVNSVSQSLFALSFDMSLILSSNTQHCTGSTIALPIQSLDPQECGDWGHHDSIDIALLRSENRTTKEHLFKAYHRFKDVSVAC